MCGENNVGIILDESAKIKNPYSSVSKSLLSLSKNFKRIILTELPLLIGLMMCGHKLDFLDCGDILKDSFEDFSKKI